MRDQDHFKRMLAQGVDATKDPRSALEKVTELAAQNTTRCPNCSNTVVVPDSSQADTSDVETNDATDPDEGSETCPYCGYDLGPQFQSFWACCTGGKYGQAERKQLAKQGKALPDLSFPIKNCGDVEDAVGLVGNYKGKYDARAHTMKHAKALGCTEKIPATWQS